MEMPKVGAEKFDFTIELKGSIMAPDELMAKHMVYSAVNMPLSLSAGLTSIEITAKPQSQLHKI
jgi:hypothetical protein